MLTPKRRSRDFGVRAHATLAQNCLRCRDPGLRRRNLLGFCEKLGLTARPLLVPGESGRTWLCSRSEATPPLPVKLKNAGRFRQKGARPATDPCRKSQHLNALDVTLPNFASRENLVHSSEANRADKVFGTHTPREERSEAGNVRFGSLADIGGEIRDVCLSRKAVLSAR